MEKGKGADPKGSAPRPSKDLLPGKNCRGEPRSPAEKRSFSDFPKKNNRIFALRRWILLWQNPRATEGRPYGYFFDTLKRDTRKGVPSALKFIPVFFRGKTVVFPEDPVEIADIFVAHGQGDVADPLAGVLQQPGGLP